MATKKKTKREEAHAAKRTQLKALLAEVMTSDNDAVFVPARDLWKVLGFGKLPTTPVIIGGDW